MKQDLEQQIAAACMELFSLDVAIELTRPEEKFGDYATNVALQLSKQLGKSPHETGEALAAKLRETLASQIDEVTVAGPGFINMRLTDAALWDSAATLPRSTNTQKVVIETNSPNPFKAMHIGHTLNAIVGDTLANLIEVGGAETHRVSYHGDVGTHVAKSMWALLKFVEGDAAQLDTVEPAERNAFMSRMYAEGAAAFKDDTVSAAEQQRLLELSFTLDDPLYKTVYETCKAWSFELLDETLVKLGCQLVETKYMESAADALGVETVKQHVGTVFTKSDGALIFEGEAHGTFTNVYVSSKGRGLYAARDLGLMYLKQRDYAPDKNYYVTGNEQKDYFKGVIKAAELCMPEMTGVNTSITTGLVKLTTGKMSSRDGNVLTVDWLFDQIETAMRRHNDQPDHDILVGAMRYQFLKVRVGGDIVFDPEEAVSITGNSGPYLQYAHARARSILRKAAAALPAAITELEADERSLVRKLTEYAETIDRAVAELMPHHICTYLYELAQAFNRFYEHNRVIGDERESTRLQLVGQYADTLKNGLSILGIASPDKM